MSVLAVSSVGVAGRFAVVVLSPLCDCVVDEFLPPSAGSGRDLGSFALPFCARCPTATVRLTEIHPDEMRLTQQMFLRHLIQDRVYLHRALDRVFFANTEICLDIAMSSFPLMAFRAML